MNVILNELVDEYVMFAALVSERGATAIVAAAVAGLQAGSFLSSCISLTLLHLSLIPVNYQKIDGRFSLLNVKT